MAGYRRLRRIPSLAGLAARSRRGRRYTDFAQQKPSARATVREATGTKVPDKA